MALLIGILAGLFEAFAIIYIMKLWKLTFERKRIVYTGILFSSVLLSILLFQNNYSVIMCLNIITVYVMVFILSAIDYKTRTIPNVLLALGMGIRAGLYVVEAIISRETIVSSLISAAAGFSFGLILLLVLSILTKHGIGYGDVKMFAWLGFCVGIRDVYSIMFYSALTAAILGVYLMLVKKADAKREIPFAPAVLVGTYLVFCFSFMQ